ncbi:MAG: glycosyltransferase [Steroidobacteraceae bacterium]
MHVLFVSDVYFPRVNGVSTSIRTFREDLQAQGVTTTLVAPQYPGQAADVQADVVRVPSGGVPRDPEDRRLHWQALQTTLERLASQQRFDLVHIHTPFIAHYGAVKFARRHRLPVVATYHTFFEEYLHHYVPLLPRRIGRAIARRFTLSQCNDVQALIAPSEPMLNMLKTYGVQQRIEVIPTGMPAERFAAGDGPRFRREHGIPLDRPLLLYVGRVAHEKNIEFLMHSFVEVRRTRPDALLVIAGEGPARESLQQLAVTLGIARDTVFVGYLDRLRGLTDCYASADVFVFASRTETQGLVLLEAMAQGRTVVSTAMLGTASILKPGCGAVVAPEELKGFSDAILKVLADPAGSAQLGVRAREYAQGWASSLLAGRMAQLYSELTVTHPAA